MSMPDKMNYVTVVVPELPIMMSIILAASNAMIIGLYRHAKHSKIS